MTTLALDELEHHDAKTLAAAARQRGWTVATFASLDVIDDRQRRDLAIHGAVAAALDFAARAGVGLIEPPLDWLARLPEEFRRRRVQVTTVGQARSIPQRCFIKTLDPVHKPFDAGVFPGGWAIPSRRGFSEDTPAMIAEPVEWLVEYRCFVVEGRVATMSAYNRQGRWMRHGDRQWPIPAEERAAVEGLIAALAISPAAQLPPAITIDIGRIAGRGWAVVEANPAWGSGLYQCDPEKVLPVLRRACVAGSDEPYLRSCFERERC